MEQQTSLFSNNVAKHPSDNKDDEQATETLDDKAFKELQKLGLDQKCHIFEGGNHCQGIVLDYLNDNDSTDVNGLLLDDVKVLDERANRTKPHHYYHYVDYHFIRYDAGILKQIVKFRKDIK